MGTAESLKYMKTAASRLITAAIETKRVRVTSPGTRTYPATTDGREIIEYYTVKTTEKVTAI